MGQRRSRTGGSKTRKPLLDKALATFALGAAMLLVSMFLGNSPALRAVGQGLRLAAPVALLLGAVLVGLHLLMQRRKPQANVPEKKEPAWTSWLPPDVVLGKDHPLANKGDSGDAVAATGSGRPAPPARTPALQWSSRVFEDIEWRRFEAVCERLFAQAGFETSAQSHGADGGVDIWLHSKNAAGPTAIVQCKHWNGRQVGVKEMREFFGVMASHRLKRGTYATTATFTADAARFARDNGINALDGDRLLALIARRTPEQQLELLEIAYQGEYWRPTCASCGVKMVERESRKSALRFWGCAHFPKCKMILPMCPVAA
jgi:restriction system protein